MPVKEKPSNVNIFTSRKALSQKGEITLEKAVAAEYLAKMRSAEPYWWAWLVADLLVGITALLGPTSLARWVIVGYAVLYAISISSKRVINGSNKIIAAANPQNASKISSVSSGVLVLARIMAVIILIIGIIIATRSATTIMAIGGGYTLLMVFHAFKSLSGHYRSVKVLKAAPKQLWYSEYVADRELREAVANVIV